MTKSLTGWFSHMEKNWARSRAEDVYFYRKDRELIERLRRSESEDLAGQSESNEEQLATASLRMETLKNSA
jgi:hypothetical protein